MMLTNGNRYAVDQDGDALLLSSRGQQVMMEWEKEYMEKCVDALAMSSSDDVLEIGFGLGYSASRIQSFRPRSHTIIECDAMVLKHAMAFADQAQAPVRIVTGTWQSVMVSLGEFDCVFFDDYPLPELEVDSSAQDASSRHSRWHDFLDAVLPHVRPGARITGYMARRIELVRDGCVVSMDEMPVSVSSACDYYPHRRAFIPVITVLDPTRASACRRDAIRNRLERVRDSLKLQAIKDSHQDPIASNDLPNTAQFPSSSTGEHPARPRTHGSSPSEGIASGTTDSESRAAILASLRRRAAAKRLPAQQV